MGRNIDEIESKLTDIGRVQDDITTKPAAANKCMPKAINQSNRTL